MDKSDLLGLLGSVGCLDKPKPSNSDRGYHHRLVVSAAVRGPCQVGSYHCCNQLIIGEMNHWPIMVEHVEILGERNQQKYFPLLHSRNSEDYSPWVW